MENPVKSKEVKSEKPSLLDLDQCPPLAWQAGKAVNQMQNIRSNVDEIWALLWQTAKSLQQTQVALGQFQKEVVEKYTQLANMSNFLTSQMVAHEWIELNKETNKFKPKEAK